MAKEKKKSELQLLEEILELVKAINDKVNAVETKDAGPGNPPPGPPGSGGGGN